MVWDEVEMQWRGSFTSIVLISWDTDHWLWLHGKRVFLLKAMNLFDTSHKNIQECWMKLLENAFCLFSCATVSKHPVGTRSVFEQPASSIIALQMLSRFKCGIKSQQVHFREQGDHPKNSFQCLAEQCRKNMSSILNHFLYVCTPHLQIIGLNSKLNNVGNTWHHWMDDPLRFHWFILPEFLGLESAEPTSYNWFESCLRLGLQWESGNSVQLMTCNLLKFSNVRTIYIGQVNWPICDLKFMKKLI